MTEPADTLGDLSNGRAFASYIGQVALEGGLPDCERSWRRDHGVPLAGKYRSETEPEEDHHTTERRSTR